SATCMIENTDKESIAIALISTEKDKIITGKQLDSLKKLIAETTSRNPDIKLDGASILFDKEVDASRKDPELSSENKAAIINGAAELKKTMNVPAENKEGEEGEEDDGTGNVIAITARVTDEDLSKYDCFPKIRTTKYFTPSCEDYTQWTSGSLPCSDGRGYCCIPEGVKRGVYEETRCQGSMSCRGQVYSYSTISKQGLAQSTPIPGVTRGLTHEGTDATPKRTVAADPNCPGFNYGSKIYIYWGEDNPWNGPYIVEDTGSAFKGRCDKLDIYVGVGKTALADAPIGDYAKVCILDENFKMPEQDFSSYSEYVDTITGDYSSRYSHDTKVYNMTKLFEKTKSFLDGTIQSCKQAAEEQKDACINNKMLSAEGNGLKVERCDVDTYKGIDLINSLPAAENPGPISPDFSKKILGEIIEEPKIGIVFGETSGEESEDYLAAVQQYNEQTQQQSEQETQTLRILAIGDSMTGAGSPSYPDQLKGILNKQGITAQIDKRHYDSCGTTIIKQCLQGAQINECQNSCRESANYNFANVDLTNYDIIIIWGSINNIGNPDQVINDLKEMYAYAKQRDKFVIAVTVAPREGYAPNVEKVNEFILNSPANVDYVVSVYDDLVDESTGGIKQEYVSSDGIHQNSAANTLIAQKIYQTAFLESISVNTEDDVRESDLLQTMGGSIVSASILLTDETGTVKINLTGEALEWINYSNTESELYISGDMLSKGDSIVANIKYDVNSKTYYIDQFSDIIANPEDIEGQEFLLLFKTLGECATSGETCRCTTPNMRILKEVSIANDTFTNTRTGEVAATQFKVQQNITLDMTNEHSLIIAANPLNQGNLLLTSSDQQNIPECIPKQKYKYICASLVGDEDLGTIGYALKI
ncbi:MAG: 3D domain-containing protein, partial [Candidatus Nanoarchaeia archaeon]